MSEIMLHGCTPEPLMGYLKALGILRIVTERDKDARGYWQDGIFVLKLSLSIETLIQFLGEEYEPTPIVAPWNAGSGFYLKWDDKGKRFKKREAVFALEQILQSSNKRLTKYRNTLQEIKSSLSLLGSHVDIAHELKGKSKEQKKEYLDSVLVFELDGDSFCIQKTDKDEFLALLRSSILVDESLLWIDAALALTINKKKNRHEAPILGSGGNIGNSDFSAMFAQMILKIIPTDISEIDSTDNVTIDLIKGSLLGEPVSSLSEFPIGQFNPGGAGSANQTQGFVAEPYANPWDYVLMCEGSLVLSGAISRRTEPGTVGASFPFTVRNSNVGYGSAGEERSRGETWLPLWSKPCSISELRIMFSEGRANITPSNCQINIKSRSARNGVEFARAVSMLGIDRGISEFVRYGYQERLGQSYLAIPLGRFEVKSRENIDLICEIDEWLNGLQRNIADKSIPLRIKSALHDIETSVYNFCKYGKVYRFADVLCELGKIEKQLAITKGKIGQHKNIISPLAGLSSKWLEAADDGSVEFEIALALASIYDGAYEVGPLRANLEPVTLGFNNQGQLDANWVKGGLEVVWNSAELSRNMTAVLERRIMDGERKGCDALPLAYRHTASLEAISQFIAGETDDERIEELLWGLQLIDPRQVYQKQKKDIVDAPPLPRAYALLKLLFLPRPLNTAGGEITIRPEPAILPLVRAHRVDDASAIAMRRLRASGLPPIPHRSGNQGSRDREWYASGINPMRLAAALLIPVSRFSEDVLTSMVIRPQTNTDAVAQ